jgi:hypothetical protein
MKRKSGAGRQKRKAKRPPPKGIENMVGLNLQPPTGQIQKLVSRWHFTSLRMLARP